MVKFGEALAVQRAGRRQFARATLTTTAVSVGILYFLYYTLRCFYADSFRFLQRPDGSVIDVSKFGDDVVVENSGHGGLVSKEVSVAADAGVSAASLQELSSQRMGALGINRADFGAWIEQQWDISTEALLRNIGDSKLANDLVSHQNVAEGAILASPSKDHPNYFFQWTRDSAITINTLINVMATKAVNVTLMGTVMKYMNNAYRLQRLNTPSGQFNDDLRTLGEAKFMPDSTAFTGAWGRPQNDGPALRAISFMKFVDYLHDNQMTLADAISKYHSTYGNNALNVLFNNEQELFDKIMMYDIKYVVLHWSEGSFDLWEEVNGIHFFTSLSQLKSLKMAQYFISKYNINVDRQFVDRIGSEIQHLTDFIQNRAGFVASDKSYIVESPGIRDRRSGLDIGTVIGSCLTHDDLNPERVQQTDVPFNINDNRVLNSLHELAKNMGNLYPINRGRANSGLGVALGRYPEDVYNGYDTSEGNPWILATAYAAEASYKLVLQHMISKQDLTLSLSSAADRTNNMWVSVLGGSKTLENVKDQVSFKYDTAEYMSAMDLMVQQGDSYLDVIRQHVSDAGEMSEEFNKYTGFLQGASQLTWSHGAFLSSVYWRKHALGSLKS